MSEVDEIRRRLQHDLDAEGVTTLRLDEVAAGPDVWTLDGRPASTVVHLGVGAGCAEIGLSDDDGVEANLAHLADQVQDDVAQSLLITWPTCPDHPHQAKVDLIDGRATWLCPKTGAVLALVGELQNRGT